MKDNQNQHEKSKDIEDAHEAGEDNGATFDMYHFFSRKDVIFVIILLVALLVYLLAKVMSAPVAA